MAGRTCHEHLGPFGSASVGRLLRLGSGVGLSAEVGRCGTALEEAGKDRLEEGVEDNLGAAGLCQSCDSCVAYHSIYSLGLGKRHPEDKDELEDVVEGCSSLA